MGKFVATNYPIDMRAGSFEGLTGSEVIEHSASSVNLWNATEQEQYIFSGSFSSFDGDDVPHSGTITGFTMYSDGKLTITASQLSFPVATFLTYVQSGNFQGFLDALLAGNDTVTGNNVNGSEGNADYLVGGGGDDVISGLNGDDKMYGGIGNDTLYPGFGADLVDGGDGIDTVSFNNYGSIGITYTEGAATVAPGQTVTLVSIEQLQGTKFADTLTNSSGGIYTFLGADGNDKIYGGGFGGGLYGEAGDDQLFGGPQNESFYGGSGIDTAAFINLTAGVTVDLTVAGSTQNTGGGGFDIFGADIENLIGSGFDDTLYGNALANSINGGAGDDFIEGGDGNDTLDGGGGYNTVSYFRATAAVTVDLENPGLQAAGGAGTDTLYHFQNAVGSAFNDKLTGDGLDNVLTGGRGDDILIDAHGADHDTAAFSGTFAQYTISWDGTSYKVIDRTLTRDDADTLTGIEAVKFKTSDVTLDLSTMHHGPQINEVLQTLDYGNTLLRGDKSQTLLIYYAFAPAGTSLAGQTTQTGWTGAQQQQVALALSRYSDVLNVQFILTTNPAKANFTFGLVSASTISGIFGGETVGQAAPQGTQYAGQALFASDKLTTASMDPGGYMFETFVHEIGHLMGLAHPHEANGASTAMPEAWGLDRTGSTVMSYTASVIPGYATDPEHRASVDTPMALDVALLQNLYGARQTVNGGGNTYDIFTDAISLIVDTGGIDTIMTTNDRGVVIDLRAATLDHNQPTSGGRPSYEKVGGLGGALVIAAGVEIENATGGNGRDEIYGNDLDNVITAKDGSDVITGFHGNDIIDGGFGRDVAVYETNKADATWTRTGANSWTVHTGFDLSDDLLLNVEVLRFKDGDVSLTSAGPNKKDFNGDGGSDVIWRNSNGELYVWGSKDGGSGAFQGQSIGLADNVWSVQSSADYNGDGKADVLFRNSNTGEIYVWASGSPPPQKAASATAQVGETGGTTAASANPGITLLGQGMGTVDKSWTIQPGSGDFNGDGRADILFRHTNGEVYLWASNQTADVNMSGQSLGVVSNDWGIKAIGDFNGDGRADVLWRNTGGDVYVWKSGATGPVTMNGQTISHVPNDWLIEGIGDFNGDGRDDILWRNTNGEVYVWNSQPTGDAVNFVGQSLGFVGLEWSIKDVGDLNGDGRADVLWRRTDGEMFAWNSHASGAVAFDGQGLGNTATDWQVVSEWGP